MKNLLLTLLLLFVNVAYAFQEQDKSSDAAKKELEQIDQQIKELQLESSELNVQDSEARQNQIKKLQAQKESIQAKYDMYIKYENGLITYVDSAGKEK